MHDLKQKARLPRFRRSGARAAASAEGLDDSSSSSSVDSQCAPPRLPELDIAETVFVGGQSSESLLTSSEARDWEEMEGRQSGEGYGGWPHYPGPAGPTRGG